MSRTKAMEKKSGQLSLAQDVVVGEPGSLAYSDRAQRCSLDVSYGIQSIDSTTSTKASPMQSGKRKWLSTKGDQPGAPSENDLKEEHNSLTSRYMPLAVACRSARSRLNRQQNARPRSPLACSDSRKHKLSGEINDNTKKLCRRSISGEEQEWCTLGRLQPLPAYDEPLLLNLDPSAKESFMPPMRPTGTVQNQKTIASSETAVAWAAPLLPTHETRPDHPLSGLGWSLDELFCDLETNRGGGEISCTQPSTTGSQGFPKFVTAGMDVSMLGHNLFGYDREDLMGCISWA